MDDENPAEQNEEQTAAGAPPPNVSKSNDSQAASPATAQQLTEVEEQMSGFEKSTLRWAKTAVIMSALAALFVCAQWWEMHEGGIDTKNLADAAIKTEQSARTSSQAAKDFADTAVLINGGIGDAVKKLDDQAKATQKSATAAQRSAKVAEDTLIVSNRPWLDIQPQIAGPFTLNEQGEARFILLVETENIGHSPAIRVVSAQGVIQTILFTPNPWQELKKTCEQATGASANSNNRGLTETIFPGKPHQETVNLGLSPKEIAKSIADMFPAAKPDPYIHPIVLWCVAYRADFSDTQHRTGYAWELMRKGPNGIIPIERNSNVPMNELVIQQIWPLGVLAD